MPIKVLRDAVDLVIKSGLRKPQELIQEIHEPVSVLWQEYFPSFEHWRNDRQSNNFVTSWCDGNGADAVALPQILNERAARPHDLRSTTRLVCAFHFVPERALTGLDNRTDYELDR